MNGYICMRNFGGEVAGKFLLGVGASGHVVKSAVAAAPHAKLSQPVEATSTTHHVFDRRRFAASGHGPWPGTDDG